MTEVKKAAPKGSRASKQAQTDDGAGGAAGPERIEESGVDANPGKGKTGSGLDDGAGGAPGPERLLADSDEENLSAIDRADIQREQERQAHFAERLEAEEKVKAFQQEQTEALRELDAETAEVNKEIHVEERTADNQRTMAVKGDIPQNPAHPHPYATDVEQAKAKAVGEENYADRNTNESHKRIEVPDIHGKAEYVEDNTTGADPDLRFTPSLVDPKTRTNKNQVKASKEVLERPKDEDLDTDALDARRQGFRGPDAKDMPVRQSHAENPDHGGISAGLGQEDPNQSSVNSIATPESVPAGDVSWVEPAERGTNTVPRQDRREDPDKDPTAPPYTPDTGEH